MSKNSLEVCHKDHAACVQSAQMIRTLRAPMWCVEGLFRGAWYTLFESALYDDVEFWVWIFDPVRFDGYERIRIVPQ